MRAALQPLKSFCCSTTGVIEACPLSHIVCTSLLSRLLWWYIMYMMYMYMYMYMHAYMYMYRYMYWYRRCMCMCSC